MINNWNELRGRILEDNECDEYLDYVEQMIIRKEVQPNGKS